MSDEHIKTHRFDASTLYLSDDGVVKCGAHVGTEATYTPWQWQEVGPTPRVGIDGMILECEQPQCGKAKKG